MKELYAIPYAQWLELVNGAKEKGIRSEEIHRLAFVYPIADAESRYRMIQNEMAKLETVLLKKVISRFQLSVNNCLEENDLEYLACGMKELKQNIRICFFFNEMDGYPHTVRKDLCSQMVENLIAFVNEYTGFVKELEERDNSLFMEDFDYICRKENLKKYIEEFNVYG